MRDIWGTDAIVLDEFASTALAAACALSKGQPLPNATPLQRTLGRDVIHAWSAVRLAEMRSRVRH